MYNIKILSECNDDNICAAIITAVCETMNTDCSLIVKKMRRGNVNTPVWNAISRKEILNNKF